MSKDCRSHELMKQQGIKKAKACSKYGLAAYYHGHAKDRKKFLPTIKTAEAIKKAKDRSHVDAHIALEHHAHALMSS